MRDVFCDTNCNAQKKESKEYLNEKVKELKEAIKECKDNNLIKVNFSDDMYVKFLRAREFDIKATITLMRQWVETKSNNKQLFVLPSKLKVPYENNLITVLDQRAVNNEVVVILKAGNWNPSLFSFEQMQAAATAAYEKVSMSEENQLFGLINVLDLMGFGWKQLRHFGPFQAKSTAFLIEKVLPIKVNQIHLLNQSKIADIAYAIIKPFLSENLRKKIHFHGSSYTEFHKVVDKRGLPEDFGGELGPFSSSKFYQELLQSEKEIEKTWNL